MLNPIKISALCPTRGRPEQMEKLTVSLFETASDKNSIELIFYIDDDDFSSKNKAIELSQDYNILFIIGKRIVLSQMWNECFKVSSGEILFTAETT